MFLPMNINLKEKKILLVGGGKVATRRTKTILDYDGNLTVVSRELSRELHLIKDSFKWIESLYDSSILKEFDYVIAATNNSEINNSIFLDCKKFKIPCLNVSNSENSDFHIPKIIRKDMVQVTISTGGEAPVISKILGIEIESLLTDEIVKKVIELSIIKKLLKKRVFSHGERGEILCKLSVLELEEIVRRRHEYENQNWV